jgi:Uncharacterized low-complexity proteins
MRHTWYILAISFAIIFLISVFWNFISSLVLPNTTLGLYDKEFFENLLTGAHNSIIDILIISIILYYFDQRKQRKDTINEILDELKYLKYYQGDDISYKYFGRLKKLYDLGQKKFEIPEAQLNLLEIKNLNINSSNFIGANFQKTRISECFFLDNNFEAAQFIDCKILSKNKKIFEKCILRRANFYNAELKGIDLRSCTITGANFDKADLSSADFRNVDCKGVSFKNTNLRNANFKGAKNLTQEMLDKASNIKYLKR